MTRAQRAARTRMASHDALVARMYADYQRGLTMAEVGAKHGGRSTCSVYRFFKTRGMNARHRQSAESYRRSGLARRARLDGLAAQMHAEYEAGASLNALGRTYGRTRESVRALFVARGLAVRPMKSPPRHLPNGQIAPLVPLTRQEIAALIARTTKMLVPPEIRIEWRSWPLARRGEFIAALRAHLATGLDRPAAPFSANVSPFDYATPAAQAIAAVANLGKPSRHRGVRLSIGSQGVIHEGRLWFWVADGGGATTGAYYAGPWTREHGRPALHRTIWQQAHGRLVPAGHVVRHRDGNLNNLSPENLVLATRNDVVRENQAKAHAAKSRARTALLLARAQQPKKHDLLTALRRKKRAA